MASSSSDSLSRKLKRRMTAAISNKDISEEQDLTTLHTTSSRGSSHLPNKKKLVSANLDISDAKQKTQVKLSTEKELPVTEALTAESATAGDKSADDCSQGGDLKTPQAETERKEDDTEIPFKSVITDEVIEYMEALRKQLQTEKQPTVAQLKRLTIPVLHGLLKLNKRTVYEGMRHPEIAAMVLDFMKIGCPPLCPKCGFKGLRFSNGRKKTGKRYYWCPGYYSSYYSSYVNCGYKAGREEVTRVPWIYPNE